MTEIVGKYIILNSGSAVIKEKIGNDYLIDDGKTLTLFSGGLFLNLFDSPEEVEKHLLLMKEKQQTEQLKREAEIAKHQQEVVEMSQEAMRKLYKEMEEEGEDWKNV